MRMKVRTKEYFELSGKVAFVPGGYGDLGKAIVYGLCERGVKVVVAGRSLEKGQDLVAEILEKGGEGSAIALDVQSVAEIREAVDAVIERYGAIDFLVNCVGIQREQPILAVTEDAFDEVYRSNLKSAMFLAQATAKHQIKAGKGGKQVHLLSVRSMLGIRGRGYSAYCSTKGGLVMLVKQHAMELAPHRINVNGVAPTFVDTRMLDPLRKEQGFLEKALARNPLGYLAVPEDVAGPTIFFCSPAADYITGQILYVDGGITASQ
jgi:NAD(P)-dependent dehydrogenase (short-subunit alcohol dehydrogenase family)